MASEDAAEVRLDALQLFSKLILGGMPPALRVLTALVRAERQIRDQTERGASIR